MEPREKMVTPEALAMIFQDQYAASAAGSGLNEWDRPRPWDEIPEPRRQLLVEVFRRLQALFSDVSDPGKIWLSSIVSHRTRAGIVQVKWGERGGQMSVGEARQMAQQFMEAAEAAETDAFIYEILGAMESPAHEQMALGFINHMRALRERKREARPLQKEVSGESEGHDEGEPGRSPEPGEAEHDARAPEAHDGGGARAGADGAQADERPGGGDGPARPDARQPG
jgi:hypothetical protein